MTHKGHGYLRNKEHNNVCVGGWVGGGVVIVAHISTVC